MFIPVQLGESCACPSAVCAPMQRIAGCQAEDAGEWPHARGRVRFQRSAEPTVRGLALDSTQDARESLYSSVPDNRMPAWTDPRASPSANGLRIIRPLAGLFLRPRTGRAGGGVPVSSTGRSHASCGSAHAEPRWLGLLPRSCPHRRCSLGPWVPPTLRPPNQRRSVWLVTSFSDIYWVESSA